MMRKGQQKRFIFGEKTQKLLNLPVSGGLRNVVNGSAK